MNRTIGWISRQAAWTTALVLISGLAIAQTTEQHWQATPNDRPNYGPNYQSSTVAATGSAAGNPAAAPAAGQYPYQPPQSASAGQQNPGYAPPANADQRAAGEPPAAGPRQTYPQYPTVQGAPGQGQVGPGQPIQGQPGQPIQGPPVRPMAPQVPFVLPQQDVIALDNLLKDWEKRNKQINVLESKFYRWRYDSVFGGTNNPHMPPPPPDEGELKFAAPDKAWMKVEAKDAKQSEQWLCDGKSVFQWDYATKTVHEWIMPPDMQGKGIGDGPLPFVFGIEAQRLKQRYYMRIITPLNVQQSEVWLEAYPKFQRDAVNYSKVEVILQLGGAAHTLFPYAIQVYAPNATSNGNKDRIVYQLQDPKINPRHLIWDPFGGDWTKPSISFGWTKRTELPEAPTREEGANRAMLQRR